jgi:hypothetical protein
VVAILAPLPAERHESLFGMSFRHLFNGKCPGLQFFFAMLRLPHLATRSLSAQVSFIVALAAFVTIFSLGARGLTEQLTCMPTDLNFGNVTIDRTETQLVVLKNSGQNSVTVSAIRVSGREFSVLPLTLPLHLSAGRSLALRVRFAPTATGGAGGKLTFTSNASNPTLQIDLEGAGVTNEDVKASPSSPSFGQVPVGRASELSVELTNAGSTTVELVAFSTAGDGFSATGPSLPFALRAGRSVKLDVKFAPQVAGLVAGSVFVSGPGIEIPLDGTGTSGKLQIAPDLLNFGNVTVGTTQTQPITISAAGASVTVSSATSSNSQFVLEGTSFPLTIDAGRSESLHVVFTPKSGGTISGTLMFASDASNSRTLESLAGIGSVTEYSVSLYWNASTSDVVGYNVYRSTSESGPYGKINGQLDPNTAYKDATVVSGHTYYYAATSVDSSGKESALSTPTEAVVP